MCQCPKRANLISTKTAEEMAEEEAENVSMP